MIILINADAYCIVFVLRKYRFGHICLLKFKLIVRLTLSAIESAPIIKMVVGDLYRRLGGYTVGAWDGDRRSELVLERTLAIGWLHCRSFCVGEHESSSANPLANDIKKFDIHRRSNILDRTKKFITQYRVNQIT